VAWVFWASGMTLVTLLSAFIVNRWRDFGLVALTSFYCLYLAASQIMATRIALFPLYFYTLQAPSAVFIYPFTAQVLDMINETYGLRAAQRAILIAFLTQVILVILIFLVKALPPAPWFELETPWQRIFSQGVRITASSWAAFLICELIDAKVFAWLKRKYPEKAWLRSVGSDLVNLSLDSLLFIIFAFWGVFPIGSLILGQIVSKNLIGFIDTPWFLWYRRLIRKKEEVSLAHVK